MPSVIIEISSRGMWKKDRIEKHLLYEMLGVKEYFIFNPFDLKLEVPFQAFQLRDDEFVSMKIEDHQVKSEVLGLELVIKENTLRLYNFGDERVFETRRNYNRTQ